LRTLTRMSDILFKCSPDSAKHSDTTSVDNFMILVFRVLLLLMSLKYSSTDHSRKPTPRNEWSVPSAEGPKFTEAVFVAATTARLPGCVENSGVFRRCGMIVLRVADFPTPAGPVTAKFLLLTNRSQICFASGAREPSVIAASSSDGKRLGLAAAANSSCRAKYL